MQHRIRTGRHDGYCEKLTSLKGQGSSAGSQSTVSYPSSSRKWLVALTLRFRITLQRGGLLRSSLNPPRCSPEQHGGVIHPNYRKTTSNKRNRRFLLGLRSRIADLTDIYCTLARNSSFTSAPEGFKPKRRQEQGKHQPNRLPIIHDSMLISLRQWAPIRHPRW